MSYSEDGSSRFSFLSFVLSVLGFFFISFYSIGLYIGIIAIILSFAAEDVFKEKSMLQYLTIIMAVVDILGALAGWNIVRRA
jgi:4-hydroxybenzoate polyprenyltransferase